LQVDIAALEEYAASHEYTWTKTKYRGKPVWYVRYRGKQEMVGRAPVGAYRKVSELIARHMAAAATRPDPVAKTQTADAAEVSPFLSTRPH